MADQRIHNTKKHLKLGYQFTLSRQASLLVSLPLSSISNFQGLSTIPWSALNLAVSPNPTNISLDRSLSRGPGFLGIKLRELESRRGSKWIRFSKRSQLEHTPQSLHRSLPKGQQAHERRVNQWAVLSIEDSQRLWCILWMEAKLRSALGVNSPQIPQHCRLQSFRKWCTFCAEPFVTGTLHKDV